MSLHRFQLIALAASLSVMTACSSGEPGTGGSGGHPGGTAGTNGTAGTTNPGTAGSSSGTSGAGDPGMAGTSGGTAGTSGDTAGSSGGTAGTTGTGTAGTTGGTAGTTGTAGSGDPPAPRPINVMGTGVSQGNFNGQPFYFNRDKTPVQGKLVLFLGGIGGGPGSGGFDTFTKKWGFHIFMPKTNTSLTGCSGSDPKSAGYRRWALWDGVDRGFGAPAPAAAMLNETIAFLKDRVVMDPGSDWGYFLNADGTLRTTDVWVVGYSWGSQTWAMMSQYVHFGRVIVTAGPVDEGCPNAAWMTDRPSATPDDAKYALIDQQAAWPGEMNAKFKNVMKAGWLGMVTNVTPNGMGTYTADQHLFAMIGSNNNSPGGHTVFCNDNASNGWIPVCTHVMGAK